MALVFVGDSPGFYAFLLLLLLSLDSPILGEVCFANFCPLLSIVCPGNSYFFEFYFFPYELSFSPIDIWIEFSKPGISQDDAILS
jgi:hypothetical protein